MKDIRISGRLTRRIIYTITGLLFVAQGIYTQQWMVLLPGSYIALMGLLGYGCAGGNCSVPAPRKK